MLVRDVMTRNPVTVASSTPLSDIRRLFDTHRFKRLPVVDDGKLVGLVTRNKLDHEMSTMLSTLAAGDVMIRRVVTVPPSATVEEGVAVAQNRKVGALLVIEHGKLAGIATTNDFFYKILNPLLGINIPGARIVVRNCASVADMERVLHIFHDKGVEITTMFTMTRPGTGQRDFTAHLNTDDASPIIAELKKAGFEVETRAR